MNNNGARPGDDANPCELDIRCFTASLAPRHNEARFFAYLDAFTAFLEDDVRHPQELVSLLHDTHWPEVPQALAVALYRTARKCKIRFTLVEEFGKIYEYVVFSAFASCEPDVVATWFLQNTDTLIRGTIAALVATGRPVVAMAPPDRYSTRLVEELGVTFVPLRLEGKGTRLVGEAHSVDELFAFIDETPTPCFGIIAAGAQCQLQLAGPGNSTKSDQFHVLLSICNIHHKAGMRCVVAFHLARADRSVIGLDGLGCRHQRQPARCKFTRNPVTGDTARAQNNRLRATGVNHG